MTDKEWQAHLDDLARQLRDRLRLDDCNDVEFYVGSANDRALIVLHARPRPEGQQQRGLRMILDRGPAELYRDASGYFSRMLERFVFRWENVVEEVK